MIIRIVTHALFVVCLLLSFSAKCAENGSLSDFESYQDTRAPQKLALVVGNYTYTNQDPLPSVELDIPLMKESLQQLGFDVLDFSNISSGREFQRTALLELRRNVRRGDLVLIYLSGHGFSYAGENYFATTEIPSELTETNLLDHSVAISSFQDFFVFEEPGAVVVLFDACRNIGDFVIKNVSDEEVQHGKGWSPPDENQRLTHLNFVVGWASRLGFAAFTNSGRPSLYTESVVRNIDLVDKPLHEVHDFVSADVIINSNNSQIPGITDWSTSTVYLNVSEEFETGYRELWESYFVTQDPMLIQKFLLVNALNPYVVSARKWLQDYRTGNQVLTSYSHNLPVALPDAWAASHLANQAVILMRIDPDIPLAFPRFLDSNSTDIDDSEIGAMHSLGPNWEVPRTEFEFDRGQAALLASAGTAIATETIQTYSTPALDQTDLAQIRISERVRITGLEEDQANELVWLEVSEPFTSQRYIPIDSSNTNSALSSRLGFALNEIVLEPMSDELPMLVDSSHLEEEIDIILSNGTTINWIVIGNRLSEDSSERDLVIAEEKALHARKILLEVGIEGTRISLAPNSLGFDQEETVVRIFGDLAR